MKKRPKDTSHMSYFSSFTSIEIGLHLSRHLQSSTPAVARPSYRLPLENIVDEMIEFLSLSKGALVL